MYSFRAIGQVQFFINIFLSVVSHFLFRTCSIFITLDHSFQDRCLIVFPTSEDTDGSNKRPQTCPRNAAQHAFPEEPRMKKYRTVKCDVMIYSWDLLRRQGLLFLALLACVTRTIAVLRASVVVRKRIWSLIFHIFFFSFLFVNMRACGSNNVKRY